MILPTPEAALPPERPTLQTSGIVRTTVFPNNIRKIRMMIPATVNLQSFCIMHKFVYTRLSKIERGEVFPKAGELKAIAQALHVLVDDLIIDVTAEDFDYEAWARENIEASLAYRGGDFHAMVLGAYIRRRRNQTEQSIPEICKITGIPAATLSRVENAMFPLDRINSKIQQAIGNHFAETYTAASRKFMDPFREVVERAHDVAEKGWLDDMLTELFGKLSIEHRKLKQMVPLLRELHTPKLHALADKMERMLSMVAQNVPTIKAVPEPTDEQIIQDMDARFKSAMMEEMQSFERRMGNALPQCRHTSMIMSHIELARLILQEHLATYKPTA